MREINFDLLRKDGTHFPALINVNEIMDSHKKIIIYRASVLDITDRKKYEKVLINAKERAERATRAKAEFLSTISHEIRTPLNAIVGIGNLLQQTNLNELQQEYAEILRASSGNLLELVNNLLDLSKLEAQKVKVEKRDFDLEKLLKGLINTYKIKASEKNVELEKEIPLDLPKYLLGDPVKLNQVLTNLFGNALKFTNNGKVKVVVSVKKREKDQIDLGFAIIDTGIGIPRDKLEDIFQEFSQVSYDINLEYGGTGLGLTISQKLLHMHGSELKVESEEGKGSKFYFDLRFEVSQKTSLLEKEYKITEFFDHSAANILLVDDNPTNLFITSQYLQNWNLKYSTVNSGLAAIEAVQNSSFDLILMDLHMPKMNGYEASCQINKLNLNPKPVVIALSASGRGDVNLRMKRSGISAYVPKPFDPLELQEVMAHFLKNKGEKVEEMEIEKGTSDISSFKKSTEENYTSFNISRYLQLANGDTVVLQKLIKNAAGSLIKFKKEFLTVIDKKGFDKINELVHKNTMTLHYLEALQLKKQIITFQELIKKSDVNEKVLVNQINLITKEFETVISGLRVYYHKTK